MQRATLFRSKRSPQVQTSLQSLVISAGAATNSEGILQDSLLANAVCFHSKWYFMVDEGVPGVSCRFWSSVVIPGALGCPGCHTQSDTKQQSQLSPLGIVIVCSPFPKATGNVVSRTSTAVQPCSELSCQVWELSVQKERSSNVPAAFQKLLILLI